MTHRENRNSLVIRLEVELPSGMAAPYLTPPVIRHEYGAPMIRMDCRVPGTSRAKVVIQGVSDWDPLLNAYADEVHVMVVREGSYDPGLGVPPGLPSTAPNSMNGQWQFSGVDGVECEVPPATYRVYVWQVYHAGVIRRSSQTFTADCYGLPDCYGMPPSYAIRQTQRPALIPEAMAYGWRVEVNRFAGPRVQAFNGNWELFIADSGRGGVVIANRPSCTATPALTLRSDRERGCWSLEFRQGDVAAHYAIDADAFRPTGENALTVQSTRGLSGEDSVPACITVRPA